MRVKFAVLGGSLLFCLAVLEAGLRLTGFAVTAARQREFVPPFEERVYHVDETFERYRPEAKRDRLILTLGDSLTNGGNVKSYHSYPYYLYRNFADAGEWTAVYNLGYCEDSTFGVALKLKHYLETNPPEQLPDAVVILVGAADMFNIPLIRERKLKDDTFWYDVLPRGWLYTLRLYKVYRHIKLNLAARHGIDAGGAPASNEEKFKLLLDVYEQHKKSLDGDPHRNLAPELAAKIETAFADDIQQADFDIEVIGDFTDLLTDYAGRFYQLQHRYDDLFALLLDIAQTFPEDFWNDYFNSANYHFTQAYRVQSRYTADDVLKVLRESEKKHPQLAHNEYFRHFRKILLDREEMDRYVDRKRLETWDEIVRMSREKNVKVVVQNYPVTYKSANRIIAQVAKKYDLPLIDNEKFYSELFAKEPRTKYMEDDDHLKPVGNQLLAQNVYAALKKAGVLAE